MSLSTIGLIILLVGAAFVLGRLTSQHGRVERRRDQVERRYLRNKRRGKSL